MVKKTIKLFGATIPIDETPRQLPLELMRSVERISGGSPPVFLARKEVVESDTKSNLNRLFVPRTAALMKALTEGEKNTLGIEENKKKRKRGKENKNENEKEKEKREKREGLEVIVVDPEGRIYNKMSFKIWPSLNQQVIATEWIKLVNENGLKKDDSVEIWSFRAHNNNQLCFAVNIKRKRDN